MAAIAGALVRNFIRARVIYLTAIMDMLWNREDVVATALLIPNFYLSRGEGGGINKIHTQPLHDLLVARGQEGLQTILYATSLDGLSRDYGTAFARLVEKNFLKVEI